MCISKNSRRLQRRHTNQLINIWKDSQHDSLLEKCKSKLQWDITSHWSEWPSPKISETVSAGKGVEKREPSYTVCQNVIWYSHCGEHYGSSFKKTETRATIWSINSTLGHISRENCNLKRYMHPSVHCTTIYNSQDMEAT